MKHLKTLIMTLAAALAFSSCAKQSTDPEQPASGSSTLSITAGLETRAWLDASGATNVLKWRTSDTLVVFDEDGTGVLLGPPDKNTNKNVTTGKFITKNWTGKTPKYAAAYCPDFAKKERIFSSPASAEGVLSVKFRNEHTIDNIGASSFQSSASVGKVESQDGDSFVITEMKNVMGFIGFKIEYGGVQSVTVESIGEECLSGWVDVDYSKIVDGDTDFWTPTTGKTQETLITVTPAPKGAANGGTQEVPYFKPGTYYIAVLPQTYAQGLKFKLYDTSKSLIWEQTVGATSGVTISRNEKRVISKALDALPETIVLNLDFSGGNGTNPLGFAAGTTYSTNNTFNYSYSYVVPGTDKNRTISVPFTFNTNSNSSRTYEYKNDATCYSTPSKYALSMTVASNWAAGIQLPTFQDRYLSCIEIASGNSAGKNVGFKESMSANSVFLSTLAASTTSGPVTTKWDFYTNGIVQTGGSLTSGSTYEMTKEKTLFFIPRVTVAIGQIKLTYTKTLPTK